MRGVRYSFIGISVWSASYYTCVMWSMKKAGVSGYFLGRVYRNILAPGSTIAWSSIRNYYRISIAVRSLSQSLFIPLIGRLILEWFEESVSQLMRYDSKTAS